MRCPAQCFGCEETGDRILFYLSVIQQLLGKLLTTVQCVFYMRLWWVSHIILHQS
jgi:hypothetical protein